MYNSLIVITINSLTSPFPRGPDDSFSWNSASDSEFLLLVDSGENDLLDFGDEFGSAGTPITYTGYTVEFGGETYAIFGNLANASQLFIPYNPADGDLAPLANGGSSSVYTSTGADVFNCFATGTRVATPDGDKTIEGRRKGADP